MTTIFQPRDSGKARQVRLSLPEVEANWLEAQAKEHNLTIHEAATQVFRFAREAAQKPERKATKKTGANL